MPRKREFSFFLLFGPTLFLCLPHGFQLSGLFGVKLLYALDANPVSMGPAHRSQGLGELLHLPLVFATDPLMAKRWKRGQNAHIPRRASVLCMTIPLDSLLQHDSKVVTSPAARWSHQKHEEWLARFCPSYKERRDHSLFLRDVSNQGHVRWRSQQDTAPSSWAADPQEVPTRMSLRDGMWLPTHGNVSILSSVAGRKTSAKQEPPNWASRAKANKNQSQHPEDSSFKHLGSAGHKCTSLLSTLVWFFSCVYTEATWDSHVYAGCTRSLCVLRALWYQHHYEYGKWLYLACVDGTRQRELELICHVTAPNQHCEAILYTEERVPWLEAWWIFRAKEHVV